MKQFSEGYQVAMSELQQELNESIKRHAGARTTKDCISVLNDIIAFSKDSLENAYDVEFIEQLFTRLQETK